MYTTSPLVIVEYRQTCSKNQHERYHKRLKKAFNDIKKQISSNDGNLKLTRKNPLAVELIMAIDQFLKHGILSSDLSYWKFLCEYLTKREVLDIKFDYGKDDNHLNCFGWLKTSLTLKLLQFHLLCFFNGERKLNVKYYSDKAVFFNKNIQDFLITELGIINEKVDFLLMPQSDEINGEIHEITAIEDVRNNFILPHRNEESFSTSSDDSIIECNHLIKESEIEKNSSLNNYLIDDLESSKSKEFKLKKMQEEVIEGDLSKIFSNYKSEETEEENKNQDYVIEKHLEMMRSTIPTNIFNKQFNGSPIEILTNDEQLERERTIQLEKEIKLGNNRIRTISRTVDELKSESVPSSNFTENCISKLKNRKNSTDDKKEKVFEKYENTFKTVKLTRNRTNPESFLINSIRNFGTTDMLGKSPTTSLAELFHEPNTRITTTGTNLFDMSNECDVNNGDGEITPISEENINTQNNYGEIPQDPGDIMHLLAEVFLEGKEKFNSMFGVFIDHSIEEPKFRYLCLTNMNIYILSKVTEGIAFACEALLEEPKSFDNDMMNIKEEDDESSYTPTKNLERKHESASYVTHLVIPLNDIDMISISYDYQSIICSSKNGCFIKDNTIVRKNNFSYCIDVGSELLGQNIFKKIKSTSEKYVSESNEKTVEMPIISIDNNIKKFFHLKFLKDELKDNDISIEYFSLIYWKHENISTLNDYGSGVTRAKLLYREEDTTSWKIVSSNMYKPWKEAYCELTYNQIIGFRDRESKDAIFSMVICEHIANIVEEYEEQKDLHIFTVIPKNNYNKTRFQLGFANYNEMCKWMNIMKEFLENSEFKEFNRPISTLLFGTKNHIVIASEHINFNEKGSMRIYLVKKMDNNVKIMYHSTDNRHVIIIFDNSNGYNCLLFRDDYELERIVSTISNIYGISILPLIELKETDKGSYFRLVQSFDEWVNVWLEHFSNDNI
ncbi:RUN domain and Pleckstrin homology-like domain-containing protein [Strongyloides ratti]|uniref:RUN domain and Pleckstrin homology-like domain-containing protein n=1 Tax=Strongyloides ratti TaxID=34506 RepID=A0A090KU11_STRRB|nr:RUN domain and Pleckstrin homology-like domain-containing protein [Strongyloides ratti]CEF59350.1 RUN domain and Pleckstrin homology-like domain-containing protein [Strongyloides ratti]